MVDRRKGPEPARGAIGSLGQMSRAPVLTYGLMTAVLASGYGVMFTVLDDFRDEYGIGEGALGAIIGVGFFTGFIAQILIAPLADRGHARQLVFGGMLLNVAGLLMMAVSTTFLPLVTGRFVMGIGIGMAVPAMRRIVILSGFSTREFSRSASGSITLETRTGAERLRF